MKIQMNKKSDLNKLSIFICLGVGAFVLHGWDAFSLQAQASKTQVLSMNVTEKGQSTVPRSVILDDFNYDRLSRSARDQYTVRVISMVYALEKLHSKNYDLGDNKNKFTLFNLNSGIFGWLSGIARANATQSPVPVHVFTNEELDSQNQVEEDHESDSISVKAGLLDRATKYLETRKDSMISSVISADPGDLCWYGGWESKYGELNRNGRVSCKKPPGAVNSALVCEGSGLEEPFRCNNFGLRDEVCVEKKPTMDSETSRGLTQRCFEALSKVIVSYSNEKIEKSRKSNLYAKLGRLRQYFLKNQKNFEEICGSDDVDNNYQTACDEYVKLRDFSQDLYEQIDKLDSANQIGAKPSKRNSKNKKGHNANTIIIKHGKHSKVSKPRKAVSAGVDSREVESPQSDEGDGGENYSNPEFLPKGSGEKLYSTPRSIQSDQ